MIPRLQNLRDCLPAIFSWPRVVRIFEATVEFGTERFLPHRVVVPQDARAKTDGRFDDGHGWNLTARENKISHRDLFVHEGTNTLVETFVTTADENDALFRRQRARARCRMRGTLWGHQNPVGAPAEFLLCGFNCAHQAIDTHHHPRASTVGRIVDGLMLAQTVRPEWSHPQA